MAQSRHVVRAHLEDVSGDVFDEYPNEIRSLISGRSGVYALYHHENLYYVGLASNLMGRLKVHLKDHHKRRWNRFSVYLTAHNEHTKELESLLLRIVNPKGNRQRGALRASENLRVGLNRRIRGSDEDERARLLGGGVAKRRLRSKSANPSEGHLLAGVFDRRIVLKAWRKGEEYRASLRRDGRISWKGNVYESPRAAASAAVGRPINGWAFWNYRTTKREWVPLARLRK